MVDLHSTTNNTEHHTSEISLDQLIVRRGQPFTLTLKLTQPFNPDLHPLTITAATGQSPSCVPGTDSDKLRVYELICGVSGNTVSMIYWLLFAGKLPSEKMGTMSCFGIPHTVQRSPAAKAVWKVELQKTSSPLVGLLIMSITPPANAPIGEYSLLFKHRGEEMLLEHLVILFNPWCPGGFNSRSSV